MDANIFITNIVSSAISIFSIVVSVGSSIYTIKKQGKQEADILRMQHNHESSAERIKNLEKRDAQYEDHRYNAIINYLKCAGGFLFADYSHEALSEFGKSVGELFMYIPADKYESVKELNETISQIATIKLGYDDGSFNRRDNLVKQAIPIFYSLCENFSDLGVKKPLAIDNQQYKCSNNH